MDRMICKGFDQCEKDDFDHSVGGFSFDFDHFDTVLVRNKYAFWTDRPTYERSNPLRDTWTHLKTFHD